MPSISQARHDFRGIRYSIITGPRTTYNRHGQQTASVDYRIAASDLTAFAAALMPGPIKEGHFVRLPKGVGLEGADHMFPERISAQSFNDGKPYDPFEFDEDAPDNTYETDAKVTVEYATNIDAYYNKDRTSEQPETILERKYSGTVEMLAITSNKNVQYQPAAGGSTEVSKDLTAPIVKLIPIIERMYRWPWALDPDFSAVCALLGCVNSLATEKFLDNAEAETVMFLGFNAELQYRAYNGESVQRVWVMDYKFAERKIVESGTTYGWNHVYNPSKGLFMRVKRKVEGQSDRDLYTGVAFSSLFYATPDPGEEEEE